MIDICSRLSIARPISCTLPQFVAFRSQHVKSRWKNNPPPSLPVPSPEHWANNRHYSITKAADQILSSVNSVCRKIKMIRISIRRINQPFLCFEFPPYSSFCNKFILKARARLVTVNTRVDFFLMHIFFVQPDKSELLNTRVYDAQCVFGLHTHLALHNAHWWQPTRVMRWVALCRRSPSWIHMQYRIHTLLLYPVYLCTLTS